MRSPRQLDFLARSVRYFWRLVIIDNSLKAGSYLLVVSVVLLLIGRIFAVSFLVKSYLLLISPLAGLVFGAVIGLFHKPSISQVALVVDSKFGSNDYFSTAYECSGKASPNPVEGLLARDIMEEGGRRIARFTPGYNPKYFYLFLVLSGIMLIIWFMPATLLMSDAYKRAGVAISDRDIITIAQGLSVIKDRIPDNSSVREFVREIEALMDNIRNNPRDKAVIIEKANKFLDNLPVLEIPAQESLHLRVLLEKIILLGGAISLGFDHGKNTAARDDTFSNYQSRPSIVNNASSSAPAESQIRMDNSGQFQPDMILKTKEEAVNNPYLPMEYKDMIKKYFSGE